VAALALLETTLSGIGHFFYTNFFDWVIRDAVLRDLSVAPWPPTYFDHSVHTEELIFILRAAVSYYLPAALVGNWFGNNAANYALFVWTVLGMTLTLLSACRIFPTRTQKVLCLLVFSFFGGLDWVGFSWRYGIPPLGQVLGWWSSYVQYSPNSTLLCWVPHHALPGWLATIFVLRHWRQPTLARTLPLLAAAVPLWSPLVAIGILPFFLLGVNWPRDYKITFDKKSGLVFIPVGLIVLGYLGLDAGAVYHRWEWNDPFFTSTGMFIRWHLRFCLMEFGLLALALSQLRRLDTPFYLSLLLLFLLPLFYYGPMCNDLALRGSIPSLTVLALACVAPLSKPRKSAAYGALLILLLLGAIGAVQEPIRSLIQPRWIPLNLSYPQAAFVQIPGIENPYHPSYFARKNTHGIQPLLRQHPPFNP